MNWPKRQNDERKSEAWAHENLNKLKRTRSTRTLLKSVASQNDLQESEHEEHHHSDQATISTDGSVTFRGNNVKTTTSTKTERLVTVTTSAIVYTDALIKTTTTEEAFIEATFKSSNKVKFFVALAVKAQVVLKAFTSFSQITVNDLVALYLLLFI